MKCYLLEALYSVAAFDMSENISRIEDWKLFFKDFFFPKAK